MTHFVRERPLRSGFYYRRRRLSRRVRGASVERRHGAADKVYGDVVGPDIIAFGEKRVLFGGRVAQRTRADVEVVQRRKVQILRTRPFHIDLRSGVHLPHVMHQGVDRDVWHGEDLGVNSNPLRDYHLPVAAAADGGMTLAGRTLSGGVVAGEPHPLALAAPPPALLPGAGLMRDSIVSASRFDVLRSGRTRPRGIAAEPKALALTAPAPVRLAGRAGSLMHQTVIPAACLRMDASGWTLAPRISAKP